MRDAANLVWKLGLVARGKADDSLLDTYESERRPHARFWVEQAATMAALVQTTDAKTAAGRDAHIRANPQDSAPTSPTLGPGLHVGGPEHHAGELSLQPMWNGKHRLDDEVGIRFLVAMTPEIMDALSTRMRDALIADEETMVLTDSEKVAALLQTYGAQAVVMRPDRYVLGTAASAESLAPVLELIPSLSTSPSRPEPAIRRSKQCRSARSPTCAMSTSPSRTTTSRLTFYRDHWGLKPRRDRFRPHLFRGRRLPRAVRHSRPSSR